MDEPLILALVSRARKNLLAAAGLRVHVQPAQVDEEAIKRIFKSGRQTAADCALAEAKARQVTESHRSVLVFGVDQILVCDGSWFNKPVDLVAARTQLQVLRGRTHELVTAACVVFGEATIWHTVVSAKLTMRHFSETFLAEQTAVLGSVGAYRLEKRGIQLFAEIQGEYFGILGATAA
jgi:septum formation protein